MALGDEEIIPLRAALEASPENEPLRLLLGQTLFKHFRYAEAEQEFRSVMTNNPDNLEAPVLLGEAFFKQAKFNECQVLVESLLEQPEGNAKAHILHARLMVNAGDVARAVSQYHKGIGLDSSVADKELEGMLGIYADESSEISEGRVRAAALDEPDVVLQGFEQPSTSFKDVGGMQRLKDEISMKIIKPMENPELFEAYGKKIGGGILMYGPPGCGKTHMARATAGEVKAKFLSVGISDILDLWMGASERNLHELFDQARANQPCVMFFDEVDALGASRSDFRQSTQRNVINQFLSELDGIDSQNDGLLILAATNTPWHLDAAFRRPGRFDRILFVPPPDHEAREGILRILLEKKPTEQIDYGTLAKKTEGYSGADLKAVVDVAIEAKLEEALKDGIPKPLTSKDMMKGVKKVKPSTREWFTTAKNYALYSNQGGVYDDILEYMDTKKK